MAGKGEKAGKADKAKDDEKDAGQEAATGGNKKKFIILGAICLALIGVAVIGTMVALNIFSGAEQEMLEAELTDAPADQAPAVKGPAIYYPLKPPIIVNFNARGRQRFLQAELTLMARDESVVLALETHMPMIRNSLVMLFGGQTYEELQTAEGKENLRQQALVEIQRLLQQETGKDGIEQVLFTNFVMQ